MTNDPDPTQREELHRLLRTLDRRVRRLMVVMVLLVLAVLVLAACVFGDLVSWYSLDPLMYGGASIAFALLGFAFGWYARRRA
jgi:hypothetical protein